MPVIDSAIYRDGQRLPAPANFEQMLEACTAERGIAWIGLYRPTREELELVAKEFEFHHLAVEDAFLGHQRSKIERYGDMLFLVLRFARYLDAEEAVEFGEIEIFVGARFVVTVRHAESPDLHRVRQRLESDNALLGRGAEAILYALLDEIVDGYEPVVAGLENDIDEIEDELFSSPEVERLTKRIYDLSEEVIVFQRAVHPLDGMLQSLQDDEAFVDDDEVRSLIRDVQDHVRSSIARVDQFRVVLGNALQVQTTLVTRAMTQTSIAQNEQMKKITSWAAILFAPSLVGSIYGMNFHNMPELSWVWGYPFALGLMLLVAVILYFVFKWRHWL